MNRNSGLFSTVAGQRNMPSMYDVVLPKAKEVESMLRSLGYTGRGIHELVTCAGADLDWDVSRAARKVASIRNQAVHEPTFTMSQRQIESFRDSAGFVVRELDSMLARRYGRADASTSHTGLSRIVRFAGRASNVTLALLVIAAVVGMIVSKIPSF
ncbi:hypothetical protein [Paraburkholderia sp. SIMBA_054]|uniref:hypothetical protein n=1 Tax=Paraburkholderia sp. SIMBA_054 TaxID=3085795 RepID=UPI00397B941E